ncbi:MAG: hypothetical protein AAF741_00290 [Bacteroidota bacterium]
MKNYQLFFSLMLAFFLVSASSCRSDDDGSNSIFFELRHDGSNLTAPTLPLGFNEFAVRFTPDDQAEVVGGQLERVQVFFAAIPQFVDLVIYRGGTATNPGSIILEQDVTANITTTGFNEFLLSSPIPITNEQLWIGVGVEVASSGSRAVGCDQGPAQPGGDHIFYNTATDWNTFQNASGESVNWNIRGIVRRPEM